MTTIKVSAIDTATAMDQILSQLGADAMILETTTRDGKVEISATNDPEITLKKPNQISDVFTQIMKEEMNAPHANQRRYANPMDPKPTLGPVLDKAAAARFMETLDHPTPQQDNAEIEISIHMQRLKWENERLAKEVENHKTESRDNIESAKIFYEQALEQGQENRDAIQSFRYEMDGLKHLVNDTRKHMVTRSGHRLAMLMLVAVMGLSVGAYGMRDHLQALVPWATSWFEGTGLTTTAMEQIEISDLDAVRMGDTVRIKGVVTNHHNAAIEAPMIRFMVKDMNGAVLVERDVMLDQDSLMPGVPVEINTQLVMGAQMKDDALTDIVAIPMQTPSQSTITKTPLSSPSQTG